MFNLEQEIKDTKVRLCLDCGKCTVVCPVAQFNPEFNPRLIIQKRLGNETWDAKRRNHLVLSQLPDVFERCNYQVKFPEFITALRTEAVKEGGRCSAAMAELFKLLCI